MGVTIHYRGRLADLTRIEDFEDRVLDLALEFGGLAKIWRSCADDNPERMVRGILLDLAPGQETTSLLIAPEGWLIGLVDIKDAEEGRLPKPPWCFVKTQFGPLEGHVALVEMFAALKSEFLPNLEVSDEGGYWATRDLAELARRHGQVQQAIEGLAEGLQRHGLSREAAEDPNLLLRHIERIAAQVQRTLRRPAEHPPVTFPDDEGFSVPDPEATEALWDEMFKHNRRQQERLQRTLEEQRSRGQDDDEAFEKALDDLALELPGEEDEPNEEPWHEEEPEPFTDEAAFGDEPEEPFAARERHPLLERATDVMEHLHRLFRKAEPRFEPALRTLFQGIGDAVGGLAQALSGRHEGEDDPDDYGLRITQLKRALRGAAFARGAVFSLCEAVTRVQDAELHRVLGQLEKDIFQELSRLRSEHGTGEA